ncbi:MAG: hypothetical protein J1E06_06440 [Acutalibacter sp.]|nr:hypothetical protein [Acutalibacter sp.]
MSQFKEKTEETSEERSANTASPRTKCIIAFSGHNLLTASAAISTTQTAAVFCKTVFISFLSQTARWRRLLLKRRK